MSPKFFQSASLKELEAASGVGRYQWSRYFNGKMTISEATLKKAASAIGMSASDLLAQIDLRREMTQSTPLPQRRLAALRRWKALRTERANTSRQDIA